MPPLPHWLLVWSLGQNPAIPTAAPPAKIPQPAVAAMTPPAAAAPPDKSPAAAPPKEVDSAIDAFVKDQAAKLDKIQNATSTVLYTLRYFDETHTTTGELRLGAGDMVRFELKLDAAGAKARFLYLFDGKKSYRFNELSGETAGLSGETVDFEAIRPLLNSKELAGDPAVAAILSYLHPYRRPGDMLRGLAGSMTFAKRSNETVSGTPVVKLEGQWRASTLALLAPPGQKVTLADLGANDPTHATLVLHQDTGWPVLLEVFHRDDKVGTIKPVVRLEFKDTKIGVALPPGSFDFAKENVKPSALVDRTAQLKQGIAAMVARKKQLAAATPAPAAASPAPPNAEKK